MPDLGRRMSESGPEVSERAEEENDAAEEKGLANGRAKDAWHQLWSTTIPPLSSRTEKRRDEVEHGRYEEDFDVVKAGAKHLLSATLEFLRKNG